MIFNKKILFACRHHHFPSFTFIHFYPILSMSSIINLEKTCIVFNITTQNFQINVLFLALKKKIISKLNQK